MPTAATQSEGTIITFYSFKGGSGRTMAVANFMYFLAEQPVDYSSVLAIDWDLEAPGLHKYFASETVQPGHEPKGLIDYFVDLYARLERDPGLYKLLAEPGDPSTGLGRELWRSL